MLSNAGHAIQKMLNNSPIAITVNETTSAVTTSGGSVYQTGLISNKITNTFHDVISNNNAVGEIIDAQATEGKLYLLNRSGSVFEYDYNVSCGSIREVYSPSACGSGDRAVQIATGRAHVLIRTENNIVWGAGSNEQYQLVPQGQCHYATAVRVLVTDTNLHDNDCCNSFTGTLNELTSPVIPVCEKSCNQISCVKDTKCDQFLGYYNITGVITTPPGTTGTLSVPIFGDISYVGFLCVGQDGCASGNITYTITRLYIKCGCFESKFTTTDSCGCHIRRFTTSSTTEILIFEASQCQVANTDTCATSGASPITGTAQVQGKCGTCIVVNIDLPSGLPIPGATYDFDCKTILLELRDCRTSLTALCDTSFSGLSVENTVALKLDFDVPLNCCEIPRPSRPVSDLPQPCWKSVYAGGDNSVLIDECQRIYVFGSIHNIRSNRDLLKDNCLERLLNQTHASVSFPADQLNCAGNRTVRNNNCRCAKCQDKTFKTDLTKFGINLSFPGNNGDECGTGMNVCDFLKKLKQCNESTSCAPTCEPCDAYIYLNVAGECGCPCGAPSSSPIGSVTLFNRQSISKLVSQGCPDFTRLSADYNTIVEFDLNRYCIDTVDVALDKIVKLDFCVDGPNVNVYIDVDQPGGIKFTSNGRKCNVDFTVSASTEKHQFLLNFGSILDPIALTNLKCALSLDSCYPSPLYKNPFDTKITNTYLKGGDRVKFVVSNPKNVRQAVTPDVPTVFRLGRRVLDVAVGYNNLTVLLGGLGCPNEVYALGYNCRGELGIGNHETIVCWRLINRCQFDCQVTNVFAGRYVTFYVTQANQVFAAGEWGCIVNSNVPAIVKSICSSWKIRRIAISQTHILLLGADGCIFGVGDNSMGELGLGHTDLVKKPTPLTFFYNLSSKASRQFRDCLDHPVEKRRRNGFGQGNFGCGPCGNFDFNNGFNNGFGGCNPCGFTPGVCANCQSNPCECFARISNNNCGNNNKCGQKKKFNPNNRICANGRF